MSSLAGVARALNPWKRTEPLQEASQQTLGKLPKVQTAIETCLAQDLYALAADDRWAAKTYRDWKVFGISPRQQATPRNSMTVADNITHIVNSGGRLLAALSVCLAAGSLAFAAWMYFQRPDVEGGPDTDTQYQIVPLPGE